MAVRTPGPGRRHVAAWGRAGAANPGGRLGLVDARAPLDDGSVVAVAAGTRAADAPQGAGRGLGMVDRPLGADRPSEVLGDPRHSAPRFAAAGPMPAARGLGG